MIILSLLIVLALGILISMEWYENNRVLLYPSMYNKDRDTLDIEMRRINHLYHQEFKHGDTVIFKRKNVVRKGVIDYAMYGALVVLSEGKRQHWPPMMVSF